MIRVLVVDDSPTARLLLTKLLTSDPEIEVVGTASDGAEGVARTRELKPDLITMDIGMPRMDGLEATRRIMEQTPTPIVVVSASVDAADMPITFSAMQAGALEVLEKPVGFGAQNFEALRQKLISTVKVMAAVMVVRRRPRPPTGALPASAPLRYPPPPALLPSTAPLERSHPPERLHTRALSQSLALVVVGASTGGPSALATLLKGLPGDFPVPILIVQHIASGFTPGLVSWLQTTCALKLKIAQEGEIAVPEHAYFAPEDRHLLAGAGGLLSLSHTPPVSHVRPSATVLFTSAAAAYGAEVAGVLLTGMGDDGAQGLKAIHDAGGTTLAQDEASSVVYGMPRAAAELGAVDLVLPLERVAPAVAALARNAR